MSDRLVLRLVIENGSSDVAALRRVLADEARREELADWLNWMLEQTVQLIAPPHREEPRRYHLHIDQVETEE
jgi:hypothetical protein